MKKNILSAALLASSALMVGSLAPSVASAAGGLGPGSYDLGGIEKVCLVKDGTWYSETVSGSSGNWLKGPTSQYGTLIFGHYDGAAGSDSIVVGKGIANWMEWDTATGSRVFLDNVKVIPTPGKCTPPATKTTPGRRNPMD